MSLQELEEQFETRLMEKIGKKIEALFEDRFVRIETELAKLAKSQTEWSQNNACNRDFANLHGEVDLLSTNQQKQTLLLDDLREKFETTMLQQINPLRIEHQSEIISLRQELKSSLAITANSHAEEVAEFREKLRELSHVPGNGCPEMAGLTGIDSFNQLLQAMEMEREV